MIQNLLKNAVMNSPKNMGEMPESEEMVEMEETEPTDDPAKPLNFKEMLEWNKYLDYLDEKKVRGTPELDKNDLGNKYFREYIKSNPQTPLAAEDFIPRLRTSYLQLRDYNLGRIRTGKATTTVPEERFMPHIVLNEKSQQPNYVGKNLTQTRFPGTKWINEENGKTSTTTQDVYDAKTDQFKNQRK